MNKEDIKKIYLYCDNKFAVSKKENGDYLVEFKSKKKNRKTLNNRIWTNILNTDGGCLLMSKNWYQLRLKIPRRFGLKPLLENAENAIRLIRKELPLWYNGEIYNRKETAKNVVRKRKSNAA